MRDNVCPGCGRPLRYVMSVNHEAPGLLGLLRGEGGAAWRLFTLVALTALLTVMLAAVESL